MTEKPPHQKVTFPNKRSNHTNLRCFYIDGKCEYAHSMDTETDINVILDKFLRDKDFIFLKEYISPQWDHIGFLSYFPETNEIFLTTDKKTKNIILEDVSTASISKERKAKLAEERRIKDEEDQRIWLEAEEKRKAEEAEKARKYDEKMLRRAKKEERIKKKQEKEKNKNLKKIETKRERVIEEKTSDEIAATIIESKEKILEEIVSKPVKRSLI